MEDPSLDPPSGLLSERQALAHERQRLDEARAELERDRQSLLMDREALALQMADPNTSATSFDWLAGAPPQSPPPKMIGTTAPLTRPGLRGRGVGTATIVTKK